MGRSKQRIDYFDNARFILIFLVVVGHMISPYRHESAFLEAFYKFIYTFHMPAFILISGFFAKKIFEKGYLLKVFQKVLLPYFIFQLIYTAFYTIQDDEFEFTLFDPHWTLWFLVSLASWHLLLLIFIRIRYSLFIAVGIGALIGTVPFIGTYLSLSRTFVFFPIFLLGYYLDQKQFERLRHRNYRIPGAISLILLFTSYYVFLRDLPREWLFASSSYADLGVHADDGVWIRLSIYAIVFIGTFAFLSIVPKQKLFFTKLGERTLYVYLLHGLVLKILDRTPILEMFVDRNIPIMLFLIGFMITWILASRPVIKAARVIVEPGKSIF